MEMSLLDIIYILWKIENHFLDQSVDNCCPQEEEEGPAEVSRAVTPEGDQRITHVLQCVSCMLQCVTMCYNSRIRLTGRCHCSSTWT